MPAPLLGSLVHFASTRMPLTLILQLITKREFPNLTFLALYFILYLYIWDNYVQ